MTGQGSSFQNGIYVVSTLGTGGVSEIWTRATDYDQANANEVCEGSAFMVEEGTANQGTLWINTTTGTITMGSGSLTFTGNRAATANALSTARTISMTGDVAYTSGAFDGSANVTGAGTLATVNSNVGTFTNATVTVNAKGLVTAAASGSGAADTNFGAFGAANLISGRKYSGLGITYEGTTITPTTGNLYASPVYFGDTKTYTKISAGIDTGFSGTFRVGIYDIVNGLPTNLIADSGDISSGGSGNQEVTGLTIPITPGWYAMCITVSQTGGIYWRQGGSGTALANSFFGYDADWSSKNRWKGTFTYGALPATFPSPAAENSVSSALVGLRF